jgi:hypothetical protein
MGRTGWEAGKGSTPTRSYVGEQSNGRNWLLGERRGKPAAMIIQMERTEGYSGSNVLQTLSAA